MQAPRTIASVWAARATATASRVLGRGGGTAASGLVGSWLQPELIRELAAQLGHGCVIITGTNGKTTTSLLISDTVQAAGLSPLTNGSGSNLVRGIASTLALATGPSGNLRDADDLLGVIEVDEATVPRVLADLAPRVAVFTNLFRDQLDRYGEVETVAALWRMALNDTFEHLHLVLNADDPAVASLGEGREDVTYFGVEDTLLDKGKPEHASDALRCRCGARLAYDAAFFGHIGHWRCETCGRARPTPDVSAHNIDLTNGRDARLDLAIGADTLTVSLRLGGLYNVYNALAAAAASQALGLPAAASVAAMENVTPAFGRQEQFEIDGRRIELYLGKNPAGLNQVISTVLLDATRKSALIALNDGIADGRDISWVWDADFELAAGKLAQVVTTGSRAAEMALRLKYAEWDESTLEVDPEIPRALERAIALTPLEETLTVIPTYTAMLEVREILAKRAGKEPFWRL